MGASVGDLDRHRFPGRLVQQRVAVRALKQERHQVFEHGPGPAEQNPLPPDSAIRAAQGKPVFQGDIASGNGYETSEARLAGQEIVAGTVKTVCGYVVAYGEQLALGIVQESHGNPVRQFADINFQPFNHRKGFAGQPFAGFKGPDDTVDPGDKGRACRGQLLANFFEEPDRIDPPVGKIEERRRPAQIQTDGFQCRLTQWRKLRFRLFCKYFNPAEIAIRDRYPCSHLLLHLPGP